MSVVAAEVVKKIKGFKHQEPVEPMVWPWPGAGIMHQMVVGHLLIFVGLFFFHSTDKTAGIKLTIIDVLDPNGTVHHFCCSQINETIDVSHVSYVSQKELANTAWAFAKCLGLILFGMNFGVR